MEKNVQPKIWNLEKDKFVLVTDVVIPIMKVVKTSDIGQIPHLKKEMKAVS